MTHDYYNFDGRVMQPQDGHSGSEKATWDGEYPTWDGSLPFRQSVLHGENTRDLILL